MKRTFTKYPNSYVAASQSPSWRDGVTKQNYDYTMNRDMPRGKVLVIQTTPTGKEAFGYYGTTEYGDLFGNRYTYYLLDNDDQLWVCPHTYNLEMYPGALIEDFPASFERDYHDYWINYNLN